VTSSAYPDEHTPRVVAPDYAASALTSSETKSTLQDTTDLDWCRNHPDEPPELQDFMPTAHQKQERWLLPPTDPEKKLFFLAYRGQGSAFLVTRPSESAVGLDHRNTAFCREKYSHCIQGSHRPIADADLRSSSA